LDKGGDAAGAFDQFERLIGQGHLDEDIAGEDLLSRSYRLPFRV
jgi:hypothetical protein